MKKKSIRQQVSDILTDWVGDKNKGLIFTPENTRKKTGAGGTAAHHDPKTSIRWSAWCDSDEAITVYCIGVTMTGFIKEHKTNNMFYTVTKDGRLRQVSIYRKTPEWQTRGYLIGVNHDDSKVWLHIEGLLFAEELATDITKKTPQWLLDAPPNRIPVFTCKIYQAWKNMKKFYYPPWSKVWDTFGFEGYMQKADIDNYFI